MRGEAFVRFTAPRSGTSERPTVADERLPNPRGWISIGLPSIVRLSSDTIRAIFYEFSRVDNGRVYECTHRILVGSHREDHAGNRLVLAFLARFTRRAAEFVSVRLLSIMAFSPAGVIRARTDGRTLIGLGRSPSGTPAHQLSHSRQRCRKRPLPSLLPSSSRRRRSPDGRVSQTDAFFLPIHARARARARPCESFNHLGASVSLCLTPRSY